MKANTMNPDQTAPFWEQSDRVHIVCNIGYKSNLVQADERADDN